MPLHHDVVCPTIIGRESQMDSLQRVLAQGREGAGRVALIVGEAGVGKSRLLRAMIEHARANGFFVLQGACFEAERSVPYAPLLDLVRLLATEVSPAIVAHVLAPAAPELVSMFPELRGLLPDATPVVSVDPESDRRRLFHTLTQSITALARTQAAFIAFEDVHWSDDATLELIFHLARSHAAHRVVIALTYRSEEVGPRLARLAADLERARLVTDIPVERLGREHVSAMLQAIFGSHAALGAEFVHVLHGLTEGNPFFVEETLKSLILAGDLAPANGQWRARPLERVHVPRTAVEAVRRRLASLSVPARALASVAAIAGRRFDFGLLQTLTRHAESELLALVKELIAAQLVVEETADRFAFRHALTREAIYAELLARERVALHREVAAALERQHTGSPDAVIEALAYHTWAAGDWERAGAYAARAARHAAELSAPHEAVAHLDRALAAAERSDAAPNVDLYLQRGRANETLGAFTRANEDFVTALGRARADRDTRAEWQSLYALGMLWSARDYARAGDYRREALRVARELGDEALVARSLNRVGNWHVNLDEPHAGLPPHEEALAIVERLGDERGIVETVDLIAMSHHCGGAQREAAAYYTRSVDLFTRRDDRRGLANALALLALCGPSHQSSSTTPATGDLVEEELRVLRSVRLARDIGWRAGEAFSRFVVADCLAWQGEYERALPLARDALALAREIEHLEWSAGSLRVLGEIALDLLVPEQGIEHLEAANAIAGRLGSHVWYRWTAGPLAVARARAGDFSGAFDVLDTASRVARIATRGDRHVGADSVALTLGERLLWLARAEVELVRHEPDRALAIADARLAAEHLANPDTRLGVPRLTLVKGQALAALGRAEEALAALAMARHEAIAQRAKPLLWRIEAAIGHVHRTCRQRLEARTAFETARRIADAVAITVPDEQLRNTFMVRLGSEIPAGAPPSPMQAAKKASGGLTRRERDVAELVARGKPNRAIARALGIGERTVEGYVTSALAKLDFTSRTQLAAWAIEKGISSSDSHGK